MDKRKNTEAVIRHRMFDRRRYRHIGYSICNDPDVQLETDTVTGIRKLLDCCMLLPYMQYDRRQGAFLLADIIDVVRDALVLEVRTFARYDTGFSENTEYYDLRPSERIFSDMDHAVDLEWNALLKRLESSEALWK